MVGGTWSPASRRRGWLEGSRDVTQGPSKGAGEWLHWTGGWEKNGDVIRRLRPLPESSETRLLKLGPIRGKATGWHGNSSTLTLPQSVGGEGKASPWYLPSLPGPTKCGARGPPRGGLTVRVACSQLLGGLKTWPPGLLTPAGPSTTFLCLSESLE